MQYDLIAQRLKGIFEPKDIAKLVQIHKELAARIELEVTAPTKGDWGDSNRVRAYSHALRQILLHRAIGTYEGAMSALLGEHSYSMVLCIRGHFEAVAALGYLYWRLRSVSRGTLQAEIVDRDIGAMLLGIRDGGPPEAPNPKSVLEQFELADRAVSKDFLEGTAKQHKLLTESYTFLCEFCHPNYHSNSMAFDLNKTAGVFRVLHGEPMRQREIGLIEYLLIAAPIYIQLHDGMVNILPEDGA